MREHQGQTGEINVSEEARGEARKGERTGSDQEKSILLQQLRYRRNVQLPQTPSFSRLIRKAHRIVRSLVGDQVPLLARHSLDLLLQRNVEDVGNEEGGWRRGKGFLLLGIFVVISGGRSGGGRGETGGEDRLSEFDGSSGVVDAGKGGVAGGGEGEEELSVSGTDYGRKRG